MLAAAMTASSSAHAFECTFIDDSPSAAWFARGITLRPNWYDSPIDAAAAQSALVAAAATWTGVECSDVDFAVDEATDERRAFFDWEAGSADSSNQNLVVFRAGNSDDTIDQWLHDLSYLALTTVTIEPESGKILDADIEINAQHFDFTACEDPCQMAYDLQNMLTHEIGHVLGLNHPPGTPEFAETTMAASSGPGEIGKRDLAQDDVDGICTIYPAGADVTECTARPRGTPPEFTVEPSCQQADGAWFVGGVLAFAYGRRRRRWALRNTATE